MLKTRARYVPWSPRQPLLALESTRREACKGRLWTSTLTEPVKLATYFKNGNEVPGGSSQAHARCLACPQSRSPRVNGADFRAEEPPGPWNNRSLETTTARARHGHGDNNFCVVGCRTTPWYGAAEMPAPSSQDTRNSRMWLCVAEKSQLTFWRNKSPKIHQPRTVDVPRRILCGLCCPRDHNPRLFRVPTG